MLSPAVREQQATDCLEAAARHRMNLLAVATRLAGSAEGGMDLYQQTVLNCHDAIQRNGFAGGRYEFYLLASIKNLCIKQRREQQRQQPLPEEYDAGPEATPELDAQAQLAEQVMQEAKQVFTANDRVVLRMHADGLNARQIVEALGGGDRTWMHRRLEKMKDYLREQFMQAWQALGE